jgi:hypothetical protein
MLDSRIPAYSVILVYYEITALERGNMVKSAAAFVLSEFSSLCVAVEDLRVRVETETSLLDYKSCPEIPREQIAGKVILVKKLGETLELALILAQDKDSLS